MEGLRNFWATIAPYLGTGGAIGLIITVIVLPFIRGKVTKVSVGFDAALEKHDKIVKEAVEEITALVLERIKTISFKQSIQPIVDSELVKITEHANEYIEGKVAYVMDSNGKIIAAIEALGSFFEDSIVPDAKKAAFAAAIEAAKVPATTQEIAVEVAEEQAVAPVKTSRKREGIR